MKKWFWGLGIISIAIAIIVGLATIPGAILSGSNNCSESDPSGTASAVTTGVGGDWTKAGTEANKNAKETFDYWTKERGTSGAAAAGIVGNIGGAEDTSFKLDQRELGGGTGGGLYQFTPWTKYFNHPKSDKSWSVKNQGDVVWELELANNAIKNYGLHVGTKEFAHETDPKRAADIWMLGYERPGNPAATQAARQAAAQKAYELFGGASIAPKDSILGDAARTADNGAAAEQEERNSACDVGSGGVADGTGKVPDGVQGKLYPANEIPDSLRQFLLPINLSDARGVNGESWAHPGGQCVDYSVSEAVALWNNTKSWSKGNGVDQVNSAIEFGYAVKDSAPHAGDIVSCDGTDPSIGHTWIVGHVFEDGSVLVQEQNYPGKSGDDMGMPKTWDVGILPPWKGPDSWSNVPNWGNTMAHATFAKPAHGMKK